MWGFGVSSRGLAGMLSGLEAIGVDIDAVCTRAKLDRHGLDDPDRYLLPIAAFRLWRAAIAVDGHEDVGVRAAAAVPFGSFEVIDYLLASAQSLDQALHRIVRYFALGTTIARWRAEEADRGAIEMRFSPVIAVPLFPAILRDFALSALVRRAFMITGSAVPELVDLAGRALASRERYSELLGCRVKLRADRNRVVFSAESRALPTLRYDSALGQVLQRHADRLLASVPRADFGESVRIAITDSIKDGEPTVATIARQLGLSARTLQRRLAENGTSLTEMIDDVRRTMALALLDERTLSIAEVGFLLGYSEPSTFNRAFKRWTGTTPSAHRKTKARRNGS